MADYYGKKNLGAEESHVILEVNRWPGKSTTGSDFHNCLHQKGFRTSRTLLHRQVGEAKLRPGLQMFVSQPAAFSVHDTGEFSL